MMAARPPIISINAVSKRFGGFAAVERVDLEIPANAFFALLGPSGCGKTTLLRMLAGFETPSGGQIIIDGEDVSRVPPNRRPVNMVFQSYAVFPHMTVADNVAYGLRVTGTPRGEIGPRVGAALGMVRLRGLEDRRPDQLSGGQRQRVALARALVKRPKVLLLDEPLSALDRKLREEMQLELVRLQHEVGITFIVVTHDQEEALSMADRVAVMERGRILQIASPRDLYEHPSCRFVAGFIGAMNLFEAEVKAANGAVAQVDVRGIGTISVPIDRPAPPGSATLAVRPEKIELGRLPDDVGRTKLDGTIEQLAYFGDTSQVYVRTTAGERISCTRHNRTRSADGDLAVGRPVTLSFAPADAILLTD
jgi:spermidine/putrescine transport system ATP-binding protein/putrescine transport system ATP-binding protein